MLIGLGKIHGGITEVRIGADELSGILPGVGCFQRFEPRRDDERREELAVADDLVAGAVRQFAKEKYAIAYVLYLVAFCFYQAEDTALPGEGNKIFYPFQVALFHLV